MPNSPESFSLPEGFTSVSDPVAENPFPADDRRYTVWKDATKTAEEEVCRLNAHYMSSDKQDNDAGWFVALVVEKFNAWAYRGLHVVWSDRDVELYDRWLGSFADGWIDLVSRHNANIPRHVRVAQLQVLKNFLGGRVQYWMAEARRYRAQQQAHESGSGLVGAKATHIAESGPSSETKTSQVPPDNPVPFDLTEQDLETEGGRKKAVTSFLSACNRVSQKRIFKKHIWQAMGHKSSRSFQYWQAMSPKAGEECPTNVRRILAMAIPEFLDLLCRKERI